MKQSQFSGAAPARTASAELPLEPEIRGLQFRTLIDVIPDPAWSAFPSGGIESCNQRWLEYTGMSLDEVIGAGLAAAIHPQDRPFFEEKWQEALAQGKPFEAEARIRRADGCYRWFSIREAPLRNDNRGIGRWFGTSVDIEELKRAQEDLLKQTSLLDDLFEQTPEAVALLSDDGRVVRVNGEFTRMFGYGQDELLERDIDELIVPDALIENSREYSRQLKQGGRVEVETVRRRKDGTVFHVSLLAVPVTVASGRQVATYARYRDITERKRAEERLLESEVRFQAIADTAPVMIWTTGTDAVCNYFSKPWLDFTGRTMEQEVGTGWTEGVHPDDLQGSLDRFLAAFHARKPFGMEYRLRRSDGEYRWVDESGIPRYTTGGEFAGYIGCNVDITERKRAEEERERLRQLEASLAHMNRVSMMGELAASLAHEIKQPIAAAVMNAQACVQWLRRDVPNVSEACEAAAGILNNAKRAVDILDRVRSLYARDTAHRELVDLNEIVCEMMVLFRDKGDRSSVSIRTELDPELPPIEADRVQLQQVMMNLMLNGIEAMKDTIGELVVSSRRVDGELLVSVSDSGIGIAADQADRMFDAFFSTKPGGTGMGLSISRKIIESHGGRLWASANSERGATFQFALPYNVR
jgi:PAS domain S-box-containing protein